MYQGSHPERVHSCRDAEDRPSCGAHTRNVWGDSTTDHFWRTWSGSLAEVDCKRCLNVLLSAARKNVNQVERRIAGKDGIQRDAFEEQS